LGSWELDLAGATYSRAPRTLETMAVIPYGIGIGIGIVGSWDRGIGIMGADIAACRFFRLCRFPLWLWLICRIRLRLAD
jgi:hypothetical protein